MFPCACDRLLYRNASCFGKIPDVKLLNLTDSLKEKYIFACETFAVLNGLKSLSCLKKNQIYLFKQVAGEIVLFSVVKQLYTGFGFQVFKMLLHDKPLTHLYMTKNKKTFCAQIPQVFFLGIQQMALFSLLFFFSKHLQGARIKETM